MRSAFLESLYSGQLYFAAVALLILAMMLPRRIAGVSAMLAVALAAFSGPLTGILLTVVAFALWSFGREPNRRTLKTVAVLVCALAIAIELPWHLDRPHLLRPSRIFVIGDSLSAADFEEVQPWPAILEMRLGVPVVNLALASADTAGALERQVPLLPPIAGNREMVILEIGGNDMLDGSGARRFGKNLDRLCAAAAGKGRDVVMFELPLLPGRWAYGFMQRRIAVKYGCALIPKRILAGVLTRPGHTSDGIHLSPRGHEALARAVADYVGRPAPASGGAGSEPR